MTYENFLKVILTQKKMEEQVDAVYKMKIDLVEFVDDYHKMVEVLVKEVYGEEGWQWYSWFCWESNYGTKDWISRKLLVDGKLVDHDDPFGARDENGDPICYDFKSTWEYLEFLLIKNSHKISYLDGPIMMGPERINIPLNPKPKR
jgi:hypothetical protein